MPEVAVLLATYNSERYLEALMDSIFHQTFQDFVCYIHDDGSKDSTKDLIRKMAEENPGKIKVLEYAPTGSAKANFVSMLKYAEEPYVMFCDHDDIWVENKIEKTLKRMKEIEGDEPCLVFADMMVVDEDLKEIDHSFMNYTGLDPQRTGFNTLLVENVVPGCTSMMNRKLYDLAGRCTDCKNIRMHDQWVALVASSTGKVSFLNDSLLLYRQHFDNVMGAGKKKSFFGKVGGIFSRFAKGDFFRENREWHDMMTRQAQEILLLPEVKEDCRKLAEEFVAVQKKNKFRRIRFYRKNKVLRRKDNFWFLIWC